MKAKKTGKWVFFTVFAIILALTLTAFLGIDNYYGDIHTVDVTVCRIRSKIEKDSSKPEYLMTKRGVGYYLCKR